MNERFVPSILLLVAAGALAGLFYLGYLRSRPASPGDYETFALRLDKAPAAEPCDRAGQERRRQIARVLDRFQGELRGVWESRRAGELPESKMQAVGPIFVRISGPATRAAGFEVSSWNWGEAEGLLYRTQGAEDQNTRRQHWRDFDTSARFLLEKDFQRLYRGRKFLRPEETDHQFRPQPSVRRTGPRELTVALRPGAFGGPATEKLLRDWLEKEWSQGAWRLRLEFRDDPKLYELRPNFRTSRSFVNHRERTLTIANYAWSRTAAHELGHVLGFDDHYYVVWHGPYCYYTQESRRGDLMSNSEQGAVTENHWQLLDRAYPWRRPAVQGFAYRFPSASPQKEKRR